MTMTQEFAALLADMDAIRATAAAIGTPSHFHEELGAFHARLEAFALRIATASAEPKTKS